MQTINKYVQKGIFIIKIRYLNKFYSFCRILTYKLIGMKVGKKTLMSKILTTFPNQVSIGKNCILEENVYFKYDGIWKDSKSIVICDDVFIGRGCEFNISEGIKIGKKAMIASGCYFIDHDHGISLSKPMNYQSPNIKPILIEEEVWLGVNVIVLKGVKIGKGAVVGAGSLVLRNIPENEIWGGVPASFIKKRI